MSKNEQNCEIKKKKFICYDFLIKSERTSQSCHCLLFLATQTERDDSLLRDNLYLNIINLILFAIDYNICADLLISYADSPHVVISVHFGVSPEWIFSFAKKGEQQKIRQYPNDTAFLACIP